MSGLENFTKHGRYILAGNHQNFCDGFLLTYYLGPLKKVNFIIAKRALKTRFYRFLARAMGSVLIGNEIEEYQRALKKLNRILAHGGIVGIFPEGDISSHTKPRRFKPGVAKSSIDSKVPVIPIYLNGTYNLRFFSYWLKRPEIEIKIGNPVHLYDFATKFGNNLDQMASVLRENVISLIDTKDFNSSTVYESSINEVLAKAQETSKPKMMLENIAQ